MPNTYKVIWDFRENTGAQFSETYYTTANNPAEATTVDFGGSTARLWLLHPLNTWTRIRVSDVANTRLTATRVVNWKGTSPTSGGPAPAAEALVANLVGSQGGSRKVWMRGITQGIVGRNATSGLDEIGALTETNLKAYFKGLKDHGYGIRRLSSQPKYPIIGINGAAVPGQAVISYSVVPPNPVPGWVAGSRVILSQMDKKVFPGLNGHWTVLNVSSNTFTIRYQVAGNSNLAIAGGFVKTEQYSALSVFDDTKCTFDHWGSHDTKNPLSGSRGARRAVRIRTSA